MTMTAAQTYRANALSKPRPDVEPISIRLDHPFPRKRPPKTSFVRIDMTFLKATSFTGAQPRVLHSLNRRKT